MHEEHIVNPKFMNGSEPREGHSVREKKTKRESERRGKVEKKVQNLTVFFFSPFSNGQCFKTLRFREHKVKILSRGSAK